MKPKVLHKGMVYELDPTKKYLIVFNGRLITKEEAFRASQQLGVEGVSIVVDEEPEKAVKIVEVDNGTRN